MLFLKKTKNFLLTSELEQLISVVNEIPNHTLLFKACNTCHHRSIGTRSHFGSQSRQTNSKALAYNYADPYANPYANPYSGSHSYPATDTKTISNSNSQPNSNPNSKTKPLHKHTSSTDTTNEPALQRLICNKLHPPQRKTLL